MGIKERVIVFDCDGTIVDTFLLIEKTVLLTFKEVFPDYNISLEEAHSFFGPFLNDSFKRYVKTKEEIDYCVERYRYYNDLLMAEYIKSYDGIKEMLSYLKEHEFNIAMVSNKVTPAIIEGLKILGLEKYFDFIVGAEMLKKAKPDPDGIYQVMDKYQVKDLIFMGDTIIDMQTGVNSNVKTVGVTWCQTKKEELERAGATFVINQPSELIPIVEDAYDL